MTLENIDFRVYNRIISAYTDIVICKDNKFYEIQNGESLLIFDKNQYEVELNTGYKDVNGNKIYENDVIRIYSEDKNTCIQGIVQVDMFSKQSFIIENEDKFELKLTQNGFYKSIEIIGNSHFNHFYEKNNKKLRRT